eukprot:TRINITY_DN50136_c0_g1_i1.p1 TRINITY_DN50136_c0_g1~~TRINITY_DN50136_c0_g1_i1.p1  ORF type:complete len:296 (+),score=78.19 TRINITY_DN50136_c0_g1_i1:88-888(+)
MRPSAARLRKYLPQEFVYTKTLKQGGRTVKAVTACVHHFVLPTEALEPRLVKVRDGEHVMPNFQAEEDDRQAQVSVIPLFSYAFPTFWDSVEQLVAERGIQGCYCEGSAAQYVSRRRELWRPNTHSMSSVRLRTIGPLRALLRWRQQRQPWPWGIVRPGVLHGGDTVEYSRLQRIFPYLRPAADPAGDAARADACMQRIRDIGKLYKQQVSCTLFHYRFAPLLAERLHELGYNMVKKEELEASSEVNELYGATHVRLVREVEDLVK